MSDGADTSSVGNRRLLRSGAPGDRAMLRVQLTPRALLRNSLLNLVGQVIPLVVAALAIPYTVRGLGAERFGLLSLAWVVLGYFTLFDLGLGRATTKYVAELLAKGEEGRIPQVVWTSVVCQLAFGVLGAVVLFMTTPFLVGRALRVPPGLAAEARGTFAVLAAGLPFVLVSSSLLGALEAHQRFDVVNAIRIPASAGTYLLPVLGIAVGADLPRIVGMVVLWRAGVSCFLMVLNVRRFGGHSVPQPWSDTLRKLMGFGAWVMVSSIVGPVLVYLDRFLVGTLVSVTAVGYYAAPYELVTRLWVVPASLVAVLFPVFSGLSTSQGPEASGVLLLRSVRLIAGALAPLVVVLVVFARDILTLWLGPAFAGEASSALQVLSIGVLINSAAHVPYALLQGTGRPDLTAKFHLVELPLYVAVALVLVARLGIAGAAFAWTLRVSVDAVLLGAAALRMTRPPRARDTGKRVLRTAGTLAAAGAVVRWGTSFVPAWEITGALAVGLAVTAFVVIWKGLLDEADRQVALSLLGRP